MRFPGLQIAGAYCPPFRALTQTEDDEVTSLINCARADIVCVGLGTPKQERWMFEHRAGLTAPVLVGVGAAFDFHTGRMAQAPPWMREHGLEWLFRLSREPGRLWRLPHLRNTICRACLTRSSGPQEVSLIPVLCYANSYAKKGRRSCLLRPVDRAKITGPTVLYGSSFSPVHFSGAIV